MGSKDRYLGSTECASILGCGGFNTPLEVYMQLTGLAPEFKPTEAMEAGNYFEPAVLRMLEDKLDAEIYGGDKIRHWRHPEYDFIGGTDDGALIKRPATKDSEVDTGVEVKLVGPHMAREFGDGGDAISAKYLLQTQHNMMTGRRKRFVVGAFFMAEMSLRIYWVDRDAELCDMLLEREVKFWTEHVLKKIPPSEDDPRIVKEYLSRRYPAHMPGEMLKADEEIRKLGYSLASARHAAKKADAEVDEISNKLRSIIGDSEGIDFDADNRCTWKKATDSTKVDWYKVSQELCDKVSVVEYAETLSKHTYKTPGSRRFLVKGPIFDGE